MSDGTSLSTEFATAKADIETLIPDPRSPYHVGPDAQALQESYRGLLRGEMSGHSEPLGPADGIDTDWPHKVDGYDISSVPGAFTVRAFDRDWIDNFAREVAWPCGFGQERFKQAVGYALTTDKPTAEGFTLWAAAHGWPDGKIDACIAWYSKHAKG